MLPLAAGLLLLIVLQQIRCRAALRETLVAKSGSGPYRIGLGALALAGLALILGGKAHAAFVYVWLPPAWLHLFVLPLMFIAFVCLAADIVRSNLRRFTRRPSLWGVVIWAVAHLLVKGDLAAMTLFGGFGLLALLEIGALKRRGVNRSGQTLPWVNEAHTVAVGGILFIVFYFLHPSLFGASPSILGRSFF